ncbi:MAG: flavodoxin domain-containing protein, partial [Chloroflexi bacterium]|nr:flavodoxin domain-containing protein [Chloroflexota bacterium]
AADPGYKLEIKETLTLKPHGLYIHAKRRDNQIIEAAPLPLITPLTSAFPVAQNGASTTNGIPMRVLYGSNAGSAEAFAQRIATDAKAQGYAPSIGALDSAVGHLPQEGAVIIVTASYEGQPPDNARHFVAWLDGLPAAALKGVKYAVFGCGNKDWARTYQAIPKKIDQKLADAGAERLIERGEANARGDFFGDFDHWYANFWPQMGAAFGQAMRTPTRTTLFEVEFVHGTRDPLIRQNNLQIGTIVENRELVNMAAPNARSKRHIELALPENSAYRAGDYLAVLPINPADNVDRALRRFGLAYDAQVVIHMAPGGQTFFPIDQPITAGELLASYVELSLPATRKHVEQLAILTPCPPEKKALEALMADDTVYTEAILNKRVSVLDLLERCPSCGLPFAAFLQMLSPLKPRQYSISSSPLWSASHCTLTLAVLDAPALSGQGKYYGVASTYLAHARPGTKVAMTIRPSNVAFHPPASLATPIILVCAGTGIAPFRGFIQDRALRASQANGQSLGRALLFFGCDHPDVDFLYQEELAKWEQQGIVSVRTAFSAAPVGEVKFVQDRLWQDRAEIVELLKQGATFFVCGDGRRMAPAVHEMCIRIYQEATNCAADEAEQWMNEMERTHARYVADVFA